MWAYYSPDTWLVSITSWASTHARRGSRPCLCVYIWGTCQSWYKANFLAPVFARPESDWNSMEYHEILDTRQIRGRKVKLQSITTSGHRGLRSCGSGSVREAYWLYAWSVSSCDWCKRDAHKILDVDKMQTLSPTSAGRFGAQFFRRQQ